jgi:hypothetical protein
VRLQHAFVSQKPSDWLLSTGILKHWFVRLFCKALVEEMDKILIVALIAIVGFSNGSSGSFAASTHIQRMTTAFNTNPVGSYSCPDCIRLAERATDIFWNMIIEGGVIGTCGSLCGDLAQKAGLPALGLVCAVVCDVLGIE